jgi:Zeta toxin
MDAALNALRQHLLAHVAASPEGFVDRYLSRFGSLLNADNASELFEEYSASRSSRALLGTVVRPAAGMIVERAYLRLLGGTVAASSAHVVVFTSGGNGSGKSTSVHAEQAQHITMDTTLSQFGPSAANIEQALQAGFDVQVNHISRCPIEAWRAVLRRAGDPAEGVGRVVTLSGHMHTHAEARATFAALARRFSDDPRVLLTVFENSTGGLVPQTLGWLRRQPYLEGDALRDELLEILEHAFAAGDVSADVHRAARAGHDAQGNT